MTIMHDSKYIPLSFWRGMPSGGGGLNRPQERHSMISINYAEASQLMQASTLLELSKLPTVSISIHEYRVFWMKMSTFVNRNTRKFLCMSIFKNNNLK